MAVATHVQDGHCIDYTPTLAVASGDVAVLGGFVAVATSAIPANTLGAVQIDGIFDFVKTPGTSGYGNKGVGLWYFDPIALIATLTQAGNIPIGYSTADCVDADLTVRIALGKFNPAQAVPVAIAASGAINPHAAAKYIITKAGVAAMTLAAPTATTDDGIEIEVRSSTAFAHTITATGLFGTGTASVNLATFAAFAGAGVVLRAYQGKWLVVSSVGITFS